MMMFPEMSRAGGSAHDSATARLAVARGEQRESVADAKTASGTSAEHGAERRLSAARAEVVAREAWVGWVERGV
jgi:hypothetical protein